MVHRMLAHASAIAFGSLLIVAIPNMAIAAECDIRPSPAGNNRNDPNCAYSYTFLDDPLAAGGFDSHEARVIGWHHPHRTLLIRPRAQFVVEMLKSVETL